MSQLNLLKSRFDSLKQNKLLNNLTTWNYNTIPVILFIIIFFLFLNFFLRIIFPSIDSMVIAVQVFSYACIFGIAALSLNLEIGNAGLSNFGKVAFIMVGSYTTGLMMLLGFNVIIAFIVAIIVTAFFGYLVSIPTLNLRADYLAIVTIVIGEILRTMINAETWFVYPQDGKFGGLIGIQIPNLLEGLIGDDFVFGSIIIKNTVFADLFYVILLVFLLYIVYIILEIFQNSPWGRVLKGMRENDIGTESLGKNIVSYKRSAFILSSGIAGFAGGLWILYAVHVATSGFLPILTFQLWIIVILGGIANNRGVIIGSFFFWSIEQLTRIFKDDFSNGLNLISSLFNPIKDIPFVDVIQGLITIDPISVQNISFGLLLILFLVYKPQGIISEKPIKTVANEYVEIEIAKEKNE